VSEAVRRVLVAYDICDDGRRDQVAVTLQGYGQRVQYSVFIVDGRPSDFVRLRSSLNAVIDVSVDRILFCELGARDGAARRAMTYLGQRPILTGDAPSLIM